MTLTNTRSIVGVLASVTVLVTILSAEQATTPPTPIASGFGAGAYPASVVGQTLVDTFEPSYPSQAANDGIEGEVLLEAVVGPSGKVMKAQVTRSATPILDAEAVKALKKWKFQPGRVNGQPVAVLVPVRMNFYTIRDGEKVLRRMTNSVALVPSGDVFPADLYRQPMPDLSWPASTREAKPIYTHTARRLKIEGLVGMEIVVSSAGTVTHARVVRSLERNAGLDLQAIKAAKQFMFTPCRLNDVPVACIVPFELQFRLPDR